MEAMANEPVLDLEDYRHVVQLDQAWMATEPPERLEAAEQNQLTLKLLAAFTGHAAAPNRPVDPEQARRALYALLIQAPPFQFSEANLSELDRLLASEQRNGCIHAIETSNKQKQRTRLSLWRGDITTLACDAIVNAANSALLGCFRPDHPCIDNAIHAKAGPRLRDDCARIMQLQGHPEATGEAKITRGYHLPARFVLHTVGPIHRGDDQLKQESECLARSYSSCLELASQLPAIRSLAFCCISTGVFGFPATQASQIAVDTVNAWVNKQPDRFDTIVFNVFSERDQWLYEKHLNMHHHD